MLSHRLQRRTIRRSPLAARQLATAAVVTAGLLAAPSIAHADSLVFLKDRNVWIANADGSGQYQVTTDGGTGMTAYASPTQADDGTIAVGFGSSIRVLRQNGTVVREFDAPALTSSVSSPMDGSPYAVAISPDGARIAYAFARYECPIGASCMARTATGFVDASGTKLPGNLFNGSPSWVSSTRVFTYGGYGSYVNIHDQGQATETTWIKSYSTDLGDGDLSADGKRFAAIHGYGDDAMVVWYDVPVDPRTTTPRPDQTPEARCQVGPLAGIAGPTWAPSSDGLAWTEPDGIWTKTGVDDCASPATRLAVPGGSEPDWGPANVNPGPRAPGKTQAPPVDTAPPATTPNDTGANGTALTLVSGTAGKATKLGKALKAGLVVNAAGAAPNGTVSVKATIDAKTAKRTRLGKKATTVASGKATAGADGTATVRLAFTKAARKRLATQKKVTISVVSGSTTAQVTLKR